VCGCLTLVTSTMSDDRARVELTSPVVSGHSVSGSGHACFVSFAASHATSSSPSADQPPCCWPGPTASRCCSGSGRSSTKAERRSRPERSTEVAGPDLRHACGRRRPIRTWRTGASFGGSLLMGTSSRRPTDCPSRCRSDGLRPHGERRIGPPSSIATLRLVSGGSATDHDEIVRIATRSGCGFGRSARLDHVQVVDHATDVEQASDGR
jgi:hypothetical protein